MNNLAMKSNYSHIIGIDEVGRGCLAGPVVVGGVSIKRGADMSFLRGIRDSKQLSEKERERWFKVITKHPEIFWGVSKIQPSVIDRINIRQATLRGAEHVYKKLSKRNQSMALLDGGLTLKNGAFMTIIKGDEKIPLISAASIVAKVVRDRLMYRMDEEYPRYGFAAHKGYGTKEHFWAISQNGIIPLHRMSFLKKFSIRTASY